jgi:archaellum component FlaF (FlaF/FlaG flagellin family)
MKTLIKLAIVVLLANAIWRAGSTYLSYYKFNDAVTDVAITSKNKTDEELREKVMVLAMQYDQPIDADAVTIRHDGNRVYIEGSYKKPVALFPGSEYQWPFSLSADSAAGATFRRDLPNP